LTVDLRYTSTSYYARHRVHGFLAPLAREGVEPPNQRFKLGVGVPSKGQDVPRGHDKRPPVPFRCSHGAPAGGQLNPCQRGFVRVGGTGLAGRQGITAERGRKVQKEAERSRKRSKEVERGRKKQKEAERSRERERRGMRCIQLLTTKECTVRMSSVCPPYFLRMSSVCPPYVLRTSSALPPY
jgi:hypothetical protein